MATNQRPTSGQSGRTKAAAKKKKGKGKAIVFAIEIVVILVMLGVLYLVMNTNSEGPKVVVLDPGDLAIPSEIVQAKEEGESEMAEYLNVALFGVDALNNKMLEKEGRSDCIMIASINNKTGDIKLVSVYRDNYLNLGNDKYEKCNAAYAKGGPKQAIQMLNTNLDMDIENFVAVGYPALIDLIDGLGGIYIDVDKNELKYINSYQISIVAAWKYGLKITEATKPEEFNVVTTGDYTPVTEAGYQLLNGLQATSYCRIRYTAGSDFKRTERQREVIKAIEQKAKKTDLATLTKIFNEVIDEVYISETIKNMIPEFLTKVANYTIIDEAGFPQQEKLVTENIGAKGNCIVPMDLAENVTWLHEFLFNDKGYEVTDRVKEINEKIKADTDKYINKNK